MDQKQLMANVKSLQRGERTRVFFESLMEEIGADPATETSAGMMNKIKAVLEDEQRATQEMFGKKTRKKEKTDDGSVSN